MRCLFRRSAAVFAARRIISRRTFSVLAIETSADDTGVAIVTHDRRILANVVVKQHATHEAHGGIHPMYAARLHMQNLPTAVRRALADANLTLTDIDGIAFTRGPGMPGALGAGSTAARTLAAALGKPLVGVHHMQAHALTALLTSPPFERPAYPFLTLLVSGGHTLLLLAASPTRFRVLATTLDSAAGRAIDKTARLLGMPWSTHGPGAALEAFCAPMPPDGHCPPSPLPVIDPVEVEPDGDDTFEPEPGFAPGVRGRLAFSFSGLQTAVERHVAARDGVLNMSTAARRAAARAFQRALAAQLEEKVVLGLHACKQQGVPVRHVVVAGGVASNAFFRERLRAAVASEDEPDGSPVGVVFPPPALCTDNGAMIAWAAMDRFRVHDTDPYDIDFKSKWSIEDLAPDASTSMSLHEFYIAAERARGDGPELPYDS